MAEPTKLPVKTESKAPAPAHLAEWGAFDTLRREIDQLFEGFGLRSPRLPFGRSALDLFQPREAAWAMTPAVDFAERGKAYEITAELPGLDDKDIEVKLANGTLTIKGEKKDETEQREGDYYLSERRYGSFVRSFRVPDGVDAEKIEATFAKGVLTVKLPKTAQAQQAEKKIAVKAA
ncbi:Hsp20/alpha crystallin family protein [Kaistia dalseonensis]|uniref:HSP20 family protein n=1 Tax=Kaistia dalseonensis TaxID=410840 RepID=A0ABU0H809_9HYPH|nr:Hsp20/alpha crystallin family protein [Kaistia dalseonensis]MCX5495842.1 Hsp20/alpha crystallin family protein [Kaistia dalseonensis]MDQ0438443.1 HSP20 family protein [Kaistia dalseonensis]